MESADFSYIFRTSSPSPSRLRYCAVSLRESVITNIGLFNDAEIISKSKFSTSEHKSGIREQRLHSKCQQSADPQNRG